MKTAMLLVVFVAIVDGCLCARGANLVKRYRIASCAVVQISFNGGMGTGFFISRDGNIVTAAHVALNRVLSEAPHGGLNIYIDYKPGLRIIRDGMAPIFPKLRKLRKADVIRLTSDLAILRTGIQTPCFLRLANSPKDMRIGSHVIAIGYPESAPRAALYGGFISAIYQHPPIPVATVNNKPVYPRYDVIRLQMPVTPGVSGAPVIGDDGRVIGVVTENPELWFNDLNALIRFEQVQSGGFNAPISDLPKMVAKLAWVVREFETSGSGLAVPVSYLKGVEQKATPPAKP